MHHGYMHHGYMHHGYIHDGYMYHKLIYHRLMDHRFMHHRNRTCWSTLRGSHGLSGRRARRTKSRGPKGLQLEVGARRAP